MLFPNYVTNHNSFEDSVKILKNRGLLNEGDAVKGTPDKAPSYDYPTQPAKYKKVVQKPEVDEQDGIYPATTLTDIPKEEVSKPIKSKNRPDGLEPAKDKDKKNEMKKVRIVKESKKSLTELTSVSDKEIQSAEFDSLKNIQKDYLSNHPLSIQPTSFSGDKGSSLKLTGLRWYNNKDNTFGFTMTFDSSGNRDEYIDVTFYKDKQNNPVKNIRLTDKIQGSWKEYKDDIVGYLNKAMRSAQVDGRYVDSVITALSRMTPEKIGNTNTFNESNIKELGPAAQQMAGNPEEERASRITMIRRRRDNDKDAEIEAMIARAKREKEEEEGLEGGFGIYDLEEDKSTQVINTPDEQNFERKLKQNTLLVQALNLINMAGELDGLFDVILKSTKLDNVSKQTIIAALRRALDQDKDSNFTSDAVKKPKPASTNPIDQARQGLRSQGPSVPNRLKEVIKKLVNEALNEYEKGDENDKAPSIKEATKDIIDIMVKKLKNEESFKKSELDDVFSKYESTAGKRYKNSVFQDVISGLKTKGYKIKYK